MKKQQMIWDFPTRFFHWSLVLSVAGVALTGFIAPDRWLSIHVWFGTFVLALILFRLVWGIVGSHYSRFTSFIFSKSETKQYALSVLKGNPSKHVGHNPLGALMIFSLLGTLLILSLSGFVALGGEDNQGPLAGLIPQFIGDGLGELHEALAGFVLFLIGGHLFGVWVESQRSKENLVKSMLTGRKTVHRMGPEIKNIVSVAGTVGLALILVLSLTNISIF